MAAAQWIFVKWVNYYRTFQGTSVTEWKFLLISEFEAQEHLLPSISGSFFYNYFYLFLSGNTKSMSKTNYSEVSQFVFLGLSTYRPVQHFFLGFSTMLYVVIVLGNLLVVFIVTFDPHLLLPSMYFLLANLSFIDLCFSALTVPKMISDLYSGQKTRDVSFKYLSFTSWVYLRCCCLLPWPWTDMWPYVSPSITWLSWAHKCAFASFWCLGYRPHSLSGTVSFHGPLAFFVVLMREIALTVTFLGLSNLLAQTPAVWISWLLPTVGSFPWAPYSCWLSPISSSWSIYKNVLQVVVLRPFLLCQLTLLWWFCSLDHVSSFTCGHFPQCQWISFLPFWTSWLCLFWILLSTHWRIRIWRWQWGDWVVNP